MRITTHLRFLGALILAGLIAVGPSRAQEEASPAETVLPVSDTPAQDRLERIRGEMTARLARLDELQRELARHQQDLERAESAVAEAGESGDRQQIEAAQSALTVAEKGVAALQSDIAAEQELYERATERFRIAREQANLAAAASDQPTSQDSAAPSLFEAIQRRDQVTLAEQEASLAKQRVEALRAEIEILEGRLERIRRETDQINQWLDEGRQLDREQRKELTGDRQQLVDEERSLENRLNNLRGQLVLAETTQRIKLETAERELAEYRYWQKQLVKSLSLLLAVVAILLLLRFLVSRYIEDPDRRFALNRSLSIAMTFVLLIGLGIIFLRQFPNLFTGIGVVLAGVAIALQEVILSFFGFFAIRGTRGYRIGDWIRMGDSYGEVVDLGLLVTILEEVTPIDIRGHRGGTKTGALIWINNNAIFREKMTNYTRGFPYIWCTLAYTVTFESNWQRGEEILRQIVEGHDEIVTTAKLARKRLAAVASDFAIKVDNTAPRVRTWTADSGIELRLRFMVHPRRRRALIDTINREVMQAFSASTDVDFAYNTLRVIPTPEEPEG